MSQVIATVEERLYRTSLTIEERAAADGGGVVFNGEGIVFNQPSRLLYDKNKGAFIEIIERGAVDDDTDLSEVLAVFNHDENRLLGANYSGTLRFNVTETGVTVAIDKPNNSVGNDCEEWVRRGDIRGMSFKFNVSKDRWEYKDNVLYRYVEKISRIQDLSLVTRAAYMQTSISMATANSRSALTPEAEVRGYYSDRAQGPIEKSDREFLEGLVTQIKAQMDYVAQAIPNLVNNNIKRLAAGRLSDLVYSQSWIEELIAEITAPPVTESPEEGEAERSVETEVPSLPTPTEQRSAEDNNNQTTDPLAWYKAKNSVHRNSLLSC